VGSLGHEIETEPIGLRLVDFGRVGTPEHLDGEPPSASAFGVWGVVRNGPIRPTALGP
jgi:hypothetical protein